MIRFPVRVVLALMLMVGVWIGAWGLECLAAAWVGPVSPQRQT